MAIVREGCARLLDGLRRALSRAVVDEVARQSKDVERGSDLCVENVPEPPHLEPGELKFGNGIHDYF